MLSDSFSFTFLSGLAGCPGFASPEESAGSCDVLSRLSWACWVVGHVVLTFFNCQARWVLRHVVLTFYCQAHWIMGRLLSVCKVWISIFVLSVIQATCKQVFSGGFVLYQWYQPGNPGEHEQTRFWCTCSFPCCGKYSLPDLIPLGSRVMGMATLSSDMEWMCRGRGSTSKAAQGSYLLVSWNLSIIWSYM